MRRTVFSGVLLVAALTGCTSADSRCNAENCRALTEMCHLTLSGDVSGAALLACTDGGSLPSTYTPGEYCPAACNAAGQGAEIACLAEHPECGSIADGGQTAAVAACVSTAIPQPEPGCASNCQTQRVQCEAGCTTKGSSQTCLDCASGCGLSFVGCYQGCPAQ
jgi:hypothetical protein